LAKEGEDGDDDDEEQNGASAVWSHSSSGRSPLAAARSNAVASRWLTACCPLHDVNSGDSSDALLSPAEMMG
jgi:hypothetical protein